jgi:lysophospholipase L1-like esterase
MANDLNAYTGTSSYAAVVHGVSGTTSGDWADTAPGSYLNSAITQFKYHGGCQSVWYMIGTNDAKKVILTDPAVYQANVRTTIAYLKAHGFNTVVLSFSPYCNASSTSLLFDRTTANSYLLQYENELRAIVQADPTVQLGDTSAFTFFQNNLNLFQPDGVHPSGSPVNAGYTALAQLWAKAFEHLFLGA